jgi:hypothetical protein
LTLFEKSSEFQTTLWSLFFSITELHFFTHITLFSKTKFLIDFINYQLNDIIKVFY